RTGEYRLRGLRERHRQEAPTIEDFIRTLQVRVRIVAAEEVQLARIAQLTMRTTQFNCTLRQRSESELRRLHRQPPTVILAVHAPDRYGDYGLVGAVIGCAQTSALEIETFLLSCRALGRGIEQQMLRETEQTAHRLGRAVVKLKYVPGVRNQMA